jgi:hypothetical protein
VYVDAITAPIFFAPKLTLTVSNPTGTYTQVDNPHYNACYLSPTVKRGIRRIRNLDIFNGPIYDTTTFYIPDNAPVKTLDLFLNDLKGVYNAEWRIKTIDVGGVPTPALYFWRKDWYLNPTPLYDFSATGADRIKLLTGLCYSWNELQLPASDYLLYQREAIDTCGNEAVDWMNGYANYALTDQNPNYYGLRDKTVSFGATKFRLDGTGDGDALVDAMSFIAGSEFITAFVTLGSVPILLNQVVAYLNKYGDYALLMTDEITQLPKILIWESTPDENGVIPYLNAKAIRTKVPANNPINNGQLPVPTPNPNYLAITPGSNNPVTYYSPAWAQQHMMGVINLFTGVVYVNGVYQVIDFFSNTIYAKSACLVNWPMFADPHFEDNMWDWFHWIDDPKRNPTMRLRWVAQIELCCPDLKLLGVIGDGTGVQLNEPIKLPLPYYQIGILKQIKVTYDSTSEYGMMIELEGNA